MDDAGPDEIRSRTAACRRADAAVPGLGRGHIVEIPEVIQIDGIPEIDGVPSAVAFFDPRAEGVTASSVCAVDALDRRLPAGAVILGRMRTRRGRRGGPPRPLTRSAGVLGLVLLMVVAALCGTGLRATAAPADGPTAAAAVSLATATSTWSPRCGLDHPTPRPAATTRCTVQVAGTRRAFVLSTPSVTGRAALVVAYHGLRQTAATFAGLTGLVASARAAGLVLALPESVGPAFNDGRLGAAGPDDDAFFVALVRQLVTAGLVDPRRVVVTGFSNGAGMAMRVAGAHPTTVAALVSIDGSLIDAPGAPRPTGAVRTVLVHGTADTVQPWRGRPAAGPLLPAYIPVPATQAVWVAAAGAGPATVRHLGGTRGRPSVTVTTWAPGRAKLPVTAYTVAGMGHVWPVATADTVDATQLVTRVAVSLDASRAAVAATVAVGRAALLGR